VKERRIAWRIGNVGAARSEMAGEQCCEAGASAITSFVFRRVGPRFGDILSLE